MQLLCKFTSVLIAALSLGSTNVSAQSYPRLSATFNLHFTKYRRAGISASPLILELMLAHRTRPTRALGFGVAVNGAITKDVGDEVAICGVGADGYCTTRPPRFRTAGLMVGVDVRQGPFSFSLYTGPSAIRFDSTRKTPIANVSGPDLTLPATTLAALQTRAEGAVYVKQRVGFVLSSTWRHVSNFRGAPIDINGVGLGIRLQY